MGIMKDPTTKIARIAVYFPVDQIMCNVRIFPLSKRVVRRRISILQKMVRTLLCLGFLGTLEGRRGIINRLDDIDFVILVHTLANNLLGNNVGGGEHEWLGFNSIGDNRTSQHTRTNGKSSKSAVCGLLKIKRWLVCGLVAF